VSERAMTLPWLLAALVLIVVAVGVLRALE